MRAARLIGPRELEIVQVPEPTPGPGEVLVRLRACGICASDLNAWRGVTGIEYPLPPGAPGHETWGEVARLGEAVNAIGLPVGQNATGLAVGQNVTGLAVGQNVTGLAVGEKVTGLLWNGLAEFGVARAEDLLAVERPLLGEPLACAMNVLRRAGLADAVVELARPGESPACGVDTERPSPRVGFVGFGYLASLCAQLLPVETRWIVLARREETRALALRLGAEAAYGFDAVPAQLWDSLPVVIEAAGVQHTLDVATWLTAYSGRLVIAGYHADGPRSVNMQSWNWKGIDVINAHDRQPAVFLQALREGVRRCAERGLNFAAQETHQFRLEDAAAAFRATEDHPSDFRKAVVRL